MASQIQRGGRPLIWKSFKFKMLDRCHIKNIAFGHKLV